MGTRLRRAAALLAAGALASGCAAPVPPPSDPAGAASPVRERRLRFDPGVAHRYRLVSTVTLEFVETPDLGTFVLEMEQEAVHRVAEPAASGSRRIEMTPDWTRFGIRMGSAGVEMALDSREPESLGLIADGGSLSELAPLFRGGPRLFDLVDGVIWPASADPGVEAGAGEGEEANTLVGTVQTFGMIVWSDAMLRSGSDIERVVRDLGRGHLPRLSDGVKPGNFAWRVLEDDPASGRYRTELRARMEAPSTAEPGDAGEVAVDSVALVMTDAFDDLRGVYTSRRMEIDGTTEDGPFELEEGGGRIRFRLLMSVELVEAADRSPRSGK
jgi:hypothetical protein